MVGLTMRNRVEPGAASNPLATGNNPDSGGHLAPVSQGAGAFFDAELEDAIEHARTMMLACRSDQSIRWWWSRMVYLINSRTPEHVERMERSRGLK